jgi:hypothetical protein
VPSTALETWTNDAQKALDEIVTAHATVGGRGRGRRYATKEINHAYAVLLSSQFQRFCRDLHTESVDHIVRSLAPATLRPVVRATFLESRKLDKGNPNPGNLGSDFGRLGLNLWSTVIAQSPRNAARQSKLSYLADWRNAIAHHDLDPHALNPPPPLHLQHVKAWRSVCNALTAEFDGALRTHLATLVGHAPW